MIVAGPSCCGKSHFVTYLIQNASDYFFPTPKCVRWFYGEVLPHPQLPGVKYQRGLPSEEDVETCISVLLSWMI